MVDHLVFSVFALRESKLALKLQGLFHATMNVSRLYARKRLKNLPEFLVLVEGSTD